MKWSPPKPGKRAQANNRARAQIWGVVLRRDPAYKCEGCGMAEARLVWAHCLGRPGSGAALGEWANSPELTAKLCDDEPATGYIGCHSKYDRHLDPMLRRNLLNAALERLWRRLSLEGIVVAEPYDPEWTEDDLKAEIRAAVRVLEAAGERP